MTYFTKVILILMMVLSSKHSFGQEYLINEGVWITLSGAFDFVKEYNHGKLEFSAYSVYWATNQSDEILRTSFGFLDSIRTQEHIFYNGIVVRDGYLFIIKNCPDTSKTCNDINLSLKKIQIPNWEQIKSDTNKYVIIWASDVVSLTVNDTISIADKNPNYVPEAPLKIGCITEPKDTLTATRIIYYEKTTDITEKQEENFLIIGDFILEQNYPNPFNNATQICYNVPIKCTIELSIYNMSGQKVRALFRGDVDRGRHHQIWDGRDMTGQIVSSGIYYLLLKSDNYIETRKMLFIR